MVEEVVVGDHSTDGTRAAVVGSMMRASGSWKLGRGLLKLRIWAANVLMRHRGAARRRRVFAAGQLSRHAARFAELRRTGGVAVLGGGAVSWWPDGARAPLLRSRSGDAEWSLLFSCCVAHPTVLLDRRAVLNLDGYAPAAEPAEDYDLWLRAADAGAGVANASDITRTWLRKRGGSCLVGATRRAGGGRRRGRRAVHWKEARHRAAARRRIRAAAARDARAPTR